MGFCSFTTGVNEWLHNNTSPEQDNDLVLMIDASDAWLQQSPGVLAYRYHQMQLAGAKVVTGADSVCWPQWKNPENQVCRTYIS